jgi:hypothetical protein
MMSARLLPVGVFKNDSYWFLLTYHYLASIPLSLFFLFLLCFSFRKSWSISGAVHLTGEMGKWHDGGVRITTGHDWQLSLFLLSIVFNENSPLFLWHQFPGTMRQPAVTLNPLFQVGAISIMPCSISTYASHVRARRRAATAATRWRIFPRYPTLIRTQVLPAHHPRRVQRERADT